MVLHVNGEKHEVTVEPDVALLTVLRDHLDLTGSKYGCGEGACGACTVLINGKPSRSCITPVSSVVNKEVTTIEGLAKDDDLHPMQAAFVKHDGFQCGYCTPGQIMSAIACVREGHANSPEEVQQYMSGNICRCGAYPNIVDAIMEVKQKGGKI